MTEKNVVQWPLHCIIVRFLKSRLCYFYLHMHLFILRGLWLTLQVVLACLSSEFVNDDRCTKLFYLAKTNMQKPMQVVLLGANQNWMKTTDIGMQVSTEVRARVCACVCACV